MNDSKGASGITVMRVGDASGMVKWSVGRVIRFYGARVARPINIVIRAVLTSNGI